MIEVKNLTQTYKSGKGVFDLNFTIKEGEVFGYLGPNGAGKTTTIRNILGFANADSGEVLINGKNARTETAALQNEIGYIPGEMAFFDGFTGKEFLDFLSHMRGLSNLTRRHDLINRFELDTKVLIKKMSKGMKQKLGIIAAFMHDPQIYILDEPTSGLDPLMQSIFIDLLVEEKAKGKTILMSSHIFEEIERVCDRAGIIRDGRIITIEDFNQGSKKVDDLFIVTLRYPNDVLLKEDFEIVDLGDGKYQIAVKENYKDFFITLAKYDVISLSNKKQSIEEIFMKYYTKEEGEHE